MTHIIQAAMNLKYIHTNTQTSRHVHRASAKLGYLPGLTRGTVVFLEAGGERLFFFSPPAVVELIMNFILQFIRRTFGKQL